MSRAEAVAVDDAVIELMACYDLRHPDATPFQRGAVEYELRKALTAVEELGMELRRRAVVQESQTVKYVRGGPGDDT